MFTQSNLFKKAILICISTLFLIQNSSLVATPDSLAEQTARDFTAVAKKAIPAVVSIKIKSKQSSLDDENDLDAFSDEFFQQFFFGFPKSKRQSKHNNEQLFTGQASGFIISKDGLLLTNSHVVREASEILITLQDGREFEGKVVGHDPNTDVAVVKIDATNLPYLEFDNSDHLDIGQWAIAIGNPLGLQASLTVGVVSATGRNNLDLANTEDFIQTDAAINRGNSGGPLLNLNGKVIGMNTAIVTNLGTGGNMGIGFAIPSKILSHITKEIIEHGSVSRGYLGVSLQEIDRDLAQAFNLKQTSGALVADVSKNSPAEKAGIKTGDIIQALNKQQVHNIVTLRNTIALMAPGTRITLTILREGNAFDLPIVVGNYPQNETKESATNETSFGFEVQELTPELAQQLGIAEDSGVIISKVKANSPAALAGLKKGILITAVNKQKVRNLDEFNKAIQSTPKDSPTLFLVKQGEVTRFLSLKVR